MRRRALFCAIGVIGALVLAQAGVAGGQPVVASPAATPSGATLQIGRVTLRHCDIGTAQRAWCGSVRVPLDYTDASAGQITVGFGWLPTHSAAATSTEQRTVVAQEGGPGYPSTGTAPDFAAMLGGLLSTRNLLVVDARGTGRSTPIDCEPLQSLPSPSPRFTAAVTACGDQLNHTFRRMDGSWVHASDLFTTANSTRDLARVLGALGLGRVDLYGDSYGTYFAQAFLARFPDLLRSVVLDSAYEARDLDPWYRTTVTTARSAFDAVCRRSLGCPAGSSWHRIARLARLLRAHPVTGRAVGTDARRHRVTLDITALVNIVNDAGYDFDPYRQLDAAARAYLEHRDAAPLLRLYAQDVGYDYSDYYANARYYSDGLYMAVACTDYPQLFDMRSAPRQRRRQLAASIRALPADTFAPFSIREWLSVLPYTETYTGCLTWPRETHAPDPPVPAGVPLDGKNVPVLILNGELDSLTPAAGGAHIARQMGPAAHAYIAANTVHLVALDSPYSCGPRVVRRFLAHPAARLDTSCLAKLPAVRAVPDFPSSVATALPARGPAPPVLRKLASVAVAAAGDALTRFNYVDGYRDLGLRGGSVSYDRSGNAVLHSVRWTRGATVSGRVTRTASGTSASLTIGVAASLTVSGAQTQTPAIVSWGAGPLAHVTIDGYRLTVPAP